MTDGREGPDFISRLRRVNRRDHAIERYLKLAEAAGARIGIHSDLLSRVRSASAFDEYPPFILCIRSRGNSKRYQRGIEETACLRPHPVVVVGLPSETSIPRELRGTYQSNHVIAVIV